MLQLYPVYLLWNRCKTLTGSLDPMHAKSKNKPCIIDGGSSLYVLFHKRFWIWDKEQKIPGSKKVCTNWSLTFEKVNI